MCLKRADEGGGEEPGKWPNGVVNKVATMGRKRHERTIEAVETREKRNSVYKSDDAVFKTKMGCFRMENKAKIYQNR